MALPLTGITTTIVKNLIGVNSNSVGDMITRALSGGVTDGTYMRAFDFSAPNEGDLIANAKPFWNIYSNESPGEWRLGSQATDTVWFRLKRGYDNLRYAMHLGGFRGYDHSAVAPNPFGFSLSYAKGAAGSSTTVSMIAKIKLGSYNWSKINGVTHCKCLIYQGATLVYTSSVKPINTTNTFINFENVSFTVSTASVATYNYTTKIVLCQSDGNELGVLPQTGEGVISIIAAVENIVAVTIAGNARVFTLGSTLIGSGSIYATGTYDSRFGISANERTLNSITYQLKNKTTNAIESTLTVTSFNAYESPIVLDYYVTGNQETFYASWGDRLTPSGTQYLVVTMEYI